MAAIAASCVFGPENGAVSEKLVYEAAREARTKNCTHLYVVGFESQPNARELIEKCDSVLSPRVMVPARNDGGLGKLAISTGPKALLWNSRPTFDKSLLPLHDIRKAIDPERMKRWVTLKGAIKWSRRECHLASGPNAVQSLTKPRYTP